ncbi:MAG: response regulator [Gemmatimonadetes bacterium]|nr:response regulator [Gemmatimonadota bacterium]
MCTGEPCRVLVVDDEPHVCTVLTHWLTEAGYACVSAASGDEALARLAENSCALLITDLRMPGRSGMDLLRAVRDAYPDLAALMVTAIDDRETAIEALRLGAFGYVVKPFDKNEILIAVANALERRRLLLADRQYAQDLEEQVRSRTVQLRDREQAIVMHLLSAAELRDDETGAHVRRIGLYSEALAERLGLGDALAEDLRLAAPMHDVGKIGIPDAVLRKPGPLSETESTVMRTHTTIGAQVLYNPDVELLRLAAEIARSHHERWDGSGYPEGLGGPDIPVAGRVVAVVDVYDALTHNRVYRPAMPEEETLSLMAQVRGTHFDPEVFDVFTECLPELREIRDGIPETRAG